MAGRKGAPPGAAATKSAKANRNGDNKKEQQKQHGLGRNLDDREQKQRISEHDRKHQQRVLDIFRHASNDVLSSPDFTTRLQSVKQALFERDFARAFGDPENLAVYAARWSPTRALCYASVLHGIQEHLEPLSSSSLPTVIPETNNTGSTTPPRKKISVISIGGAAAELVALGAFLNQWPSSSSIAGSITLVDSGPWSTVVSHLTTALTTAPPISKYASAAAKLSNTAMVPPSHFTQTFVQHDALALGPERLASLVGDGNTATATPTPVLITILFTLNELFTAGGIGKTTAFLLDLTSCIPLGSLLLVVDSPGSYSETSVGKEAKRYPMQWLLDRVMLGTRREPVNGRRWAKLEARDSAWFRLADTLDYPIQLENMRYQMHLYKAEDASIEVDDE
ncbi:hypothetical protein VTK26DRAFT_8279 [Humicola hyalothermophila]